MPLFKRILYYLGGFAIGLVILFFFLGGKRASCDYGPNARTLKNIRSKKRVFSTASLNQLQKHQLDTAIVANLLREGKVIFSESNTSLDNCKEYVIQGYEGKQTLKITIANCEKIATVKTISVE